MAGWKGWTESLRHEVGRFGIRVALVEPGDVKTGFTGSRVVVAGHDSSSAYAEQFAKCMGIVEKEEQQGVAPAVVAGLVLRIVEGKATGARYTVGHFSQRLAPVLKRVLPGGPFEGIMAGFYGIK